MCRLIAYIGDRLLLADALIKPDNSLVKQSLSAKETTSLTNGDGFGLGWYVPEISTEPALFSSIFPAWNDENLLHLANKTKAPLFFAHVRAASIGGVNTYNCHPFIYQNWMFMHNGQINNFSAIKRALRHLLDDDIYNWIRGETDSEHLFALFLQLAKGKDLSQLTHIAQLLQTTFKTIQQLLHQTGVDTTSYYNICMTDGQRIIASRYCTDSHIAPESLHFLEGSYFWSKNNGLETNPQKPQHCVLIASEQLTDFNDQWQVVPGNHFLLVDSDYSVSIKPIVL